MRYMRTVKILIQSIVTLAIIGALIYLVITQHLISRLETRLAPCSSPIAYSIGSFDARFGVSQADFLTDMQKAEKIWEGGANKQLFTYDVNGPLKINLVYDSRQQNTERLAKIGVVISGDRTTYDSLSVKYNAFKAEYTVKKQRYDSLLADYNAKKATYNQQVSFWNSQGGAPRDKFQELRTEADALNAEVGQINDMQSGMNDLVGTINVLASAINEVARVLNLNAANYNTIGASQGVTFEEGAYISDLTGTHIDIYQFSDQTRLIRVLAHELGHALGLAHVSSSKSIMYYLNEAGNEKLSPEDLAALKNKCGIK
jgi:Matrixin